MEEHLGQRGKELWANIGQVPGLDIASKTLVLQVCRIADHLDRLDRILHSKQTWISLANEGVPNEDGQINIVMDGALVEFRQQASALSAILNKLGLGKIDFDALVARQTESRSDELHRKRAERTRNVATQA